MMWTNGWESVQESVWDVVRSIALHSICFDLYYLELIYTLQLRISHMNKSLNNLFLWEKEERMGDTG